MRNWTPCLLSLSLACGDDGATGGGGSTQAGTITGQDSTRVSATAASSSTTSSASATASNAASSSSGAGPCGDGRCAPDEDATTCCSDCSICDDNGFVTMTVGVPQGAPLGGFTPGGMADTHAYFAGGGFTEYVFPLRVVDEPVPGTSYFWAQQFFFEGTTQGGYTGMQTGGIQQGQVVGKMFIFSIWDAPSATPGPGATCEPFGGEGVGQSCRLPFEWRENVTYRFALRETSTDTWSLAVYDPTLPGERLLGSINVLPTWDRLRPPTAGFTEYFGQVAGCEALPLTSAVFHMPTADGAPPTSVEGATYGPCAAQASSVCSGALCN